jgi:acyl carrier protein
VLPVSWSDWLAPFGDDVPPPWRELRAAAPATAKTATADLREVAPADRRAALRRVVSTHVAQALGFADPAPLAHHVTFRDLGLDSLLAIEAKDRLERALGRTLPATLLFDHPDVERLVAHLLESSPANA